VTSPCCILMKYLIISVVRYEESRRTHWESTYCLLEYHLQKYVFAIGISDLEGSVNSTFSLLACQLQKSLSFIWEKRIIIRIARDLEGNVSGLFCLIAVRERREFQDGR